MKQTKDYTIPLIGFIVIAILAASCSIKRYSYEAVNLQPGEISKYHERCQLVKIKPPVNFNNSRGYKHWFVSDKNDTLIRYYQKPLEINQCYYVWKTKTDK